MADQTPITLCDLDTSVPDWIIDHPETLSVFREFGIDVCCGGKSLEYACEQQGVDANLVLKELRSAIALAAEKARGESDGDSPCKPGRRD